MFKYFLDDVEEVAEKVITLTKSRILLIQGDMGVGKTTLAKALVKALGSPDEVSSPTFSIVNEYKAVSGESIYHFDLYRLKSLEEALDFGIEDYLYSGNWCLMEWPEMIQDYLSMDFEMVHICLNEDKSRNLKLLYSQHNNTPNHVL